MATVIFDDAAVQIPAWVVDLASFRRWWESDEFPEEGRICFINGEVWADMSRQQIFSHLRVKATLNTTIDGLVRKAGTGLYLPDGLRVFHTATELSAVPDGAFLSFDSIRAGRVTLVEGREGGYTAAEGSPDLVFEVVSDSSEDKDTEWQMRAYWEADIREYWLIDAREEPPRFDVYKHGPKGFTASRKSAGWIKSAVLGKSFRLEATRNALGHPDYVLQVR
jgi:Uma2 family endonuclease